MNFPFKLFDEFIQTQKGFKIKSKPGYVKRIEKPGIQFFKKRLFNLSGQNCLWFTNEVHPCL